MNCIMNESERITSAYFNKKGIQISKKNRGFDFIEQKGITIVETKANILTDNQVKELLYHKCNVLESEIYISIVQSVQGIPVLLVFKLQDIQPNGHQLKSVYLKQNNEAISKVMVDRYGATRISLRQNLIKKYGLEGWEMLIQTDDYCGGIVIKKSISKVVRRKINTKTYQIAIPRILVKSQGFKSNDIVMVEDDERCGGIRIRKCR